MIKKTINNIIVSRSRNQAARRLEDIIHYAERNGEPWLAGFMVGGDIIATALAKGSNGLIWPLGLTDAVSIDEGRRVAADKTLVAVLPHQ